MGSGNRVIGNRFVNLNLAGCNESAPKIPCIYKATSRRCSKAASIWAAARRARSRPRGNVIRDNEISGHKMKIALHRVRPRRVAFGEHRRGQHLLRRRRLPGDVS